jgi:hypothetical protein
VWKGQGKDNEVTCLSKKKMVPRRADGRRAKRCLCLGSFFCGAVISELLVLSYLHARWPLLEHPISPPTTNNVMGDAADSRPQRNLEGESFGGVSVVYRQGSRPPASSVHCIGENFEADAWKYRSCRYQNLCFDRLDKEFVYLQNSREAALMESYQQNPNFKFISVSTVQHDNAAVSLGQINRQIAPTETIRALQWTPKVRRHSDFSDTSYYELASDAVWVPFASYNGLDIYFTFYTLLSSFGLIDEDIRPLFMELETSSELLCSSEHCFGIHKPSLPLFGLLESRGSGLDGSFLEQQQQTARLVCAKQAVAGIGMIADRGLNPPGVISSTHNHGVTVNLPTHNLAQGKIRQGFRDFILRNLGGRLSDPSHQKANSLVVSWYDKASEYDAGKVREQLKRASSSAEVEFLELEKLEPKSFAAAATSIAKSCVLLVRCCAAEAALAATFLPPGSTLIVFYDPKEFGGEQAAKRASPIWDLVDSAAYFQAHWFPLGGEQDAIVLVGQKLQRQFPWNQVAS